MFFLERSWSRVGIHFWCISFPFVICNLLLSLTLAYDNSFGCLLFAALCLGIRETAFELCVMGKLDAMERLMIGFMNGFLFSILMALSFAASYALIHVMLYQILMPPLVFQCLFALCLPLARGLLQMLVAHFLSSAAILLRDVEDFSHVPQFDSLVIYADVAFVMWMMLQVPCAFFILVVPNVVTFGVAASSNVVIDIFFVHALDALQKQRRKPCISTEENTPKFCMERPVSVVATLMGGRLGDGRLSEETHLNLNLLDQLGTTARQACTCCRMKNQTTSEPAEMSPRVSLLHDEFDHMAIRCEHQIQNGLGWTVFLYQERKLTFATHLVTNTVAVALACVSVPLLWPHGVQWGAFGVRVFALIALRLVADYACCLVLHNGSAELLSKERWALWEGRLDLATPASWMCRVVAASCPLLPVIAAAR